MGTCRSKEDFLKDIPVSLPVYAPHHDLVGRDIFVIFNIIIIYTRQPTLWENPFG